MPTKRSIDDFFSALTDDAVKGDVLKAQIAADAATEKTRIEQEEQTKRAKVGGSDYQVARVFIALFVCAVVSGGLFVCCNHQDNQVKIAELNNRHAILAEELRHALVADAGTGDR